MGYRDQTVAALARTTALEDELTTLRENLARSELHLRARDSEAPEATETELTRLRGQLALARWQLERKERLADSKPSTAEAADSADTVKQLKEALKVQRSLADQTGLTYQGALLCFSLIVLIPRLSLPDAVGKVAMVALVIGHLGCVARSLFLERKRFLQRKRARQQF